MSGYSIWKNNIIAMTECEFKREVSDLENHVDALCMGKLSRIQMKAMIISPVQEPDRVALINPYIYK